ncbi:MAG TPA: tetratricopeptide repeat protein [Candidatus Angelobacter sp.]|nr:tetratricopeptide repeat protein [Candidatus Angelobacter sp.]
MKSPSCASLLLLLRALLALALAAPLLAQPRQEIKSPGERSVLEADLALQDPAARAAALTEFLERYPNTSEKHTALAAAMDAFEQAGDLTDAASMARALLQIVPNDARALALIESVNSSPGRPLPLVGELPADPMAAFICKMDLSSNDLGFLDWEYILSLRDVSPCNRLAADVVWEEVLQRQRVFKINIKAQVLSSTTDTIVASANDYEGLKRNSLKQCKSAYCSVVPQPGAADLRVTLATPLPYALPVGAVTSISGTLTGYAVQPFSFSMENADLPEWPKFGCRPTYYKYPAYTRYPALPVQEYLLEHRDATNCSQEAADSIWKSISAGRHIFTAQVVSATAYDMQAALIDTNPSSNTKGWKSPKNDLHVTFTRPFPFVPQPGPEVKVEGVVTGYGTAPFQFRMEEGESPQLICAWVKQVGVNALSFEDSLYVLRYPRTDQCIADASSDVWEALTLHHRERGGFQFRAHVVSATPRQIDAILDIKLDEEIYLDIRMLKPLEQVPAPGATIDMKGYLHLYTSRLRDQDRQKPFTLVIGGASLVRVNSAR